MSTVSFLFYTTFLHFTIINSETIDCGQTNCINEQFVFTSGKNSVLCNNDAFCTGLSIYSSAPEVDILCYAKDACENIKVFCGEFDPPGPEYDLSDMTGTGINCWIECSDELGYTCYNIALSCKGDGIAACSIDSEFSTNIVDSTLECDIPAPSECLMACGFNRCDGSNEILCHTGSTCTCSGSSCSTVETIPVTPNPTHMPSLSPITNIPTTSFPTTTAPTTSKPTTNFPTTNFPTTHIPTTTFPTTNFPTTTSPTTTIPTTNFPTTTTPTSAPTTTNPTTISPTTNVPTTRIPTTSNPTETDLVIPSPSYRPTEYPVSSTNAYEKNIEKTQTTVIASENNEGNKAEGTGLIDMITGSTAMLILIVFIVIFILLCIFLCYMVNKIRKKMKGAKIKKNDTVNFERKGIELVGVSRVSSMSDGDVQNNTTELVKPITDIDNESMYGKPNGMMMTPMLLTNMITDGVMNVDTGMTPDVNGEGESSKSSDHDNLEAMYNLTKPTRGGD